MTDLTIGTTAYHLVATERSGQWTAHAVRVETGERFGLETTASSKDDALLRLERWLEWQFEHTQALEALQAAERVYHRAMADAAFALAPVSAADSRASLEAVDAARSRLDEVRLQRPAV